jgi:hypothetical protein
MRQELGNNSKKETWRTGIGLRNIGGIGDKTEDRRH